MLCVDIDRMRKHVTVGNVAGNDSHLRTQRIRKNIIAGIDVSCFPLV